MSFRRIPFQFTTTDPTERHAELLRRFGVPKEDDMLVENPNSPAMDGFCGPSSPRLQHRIPNLMAERRGSPSSKENGAENVDSRKSAPRVRVIPIQVEGVATSDRPNRQRTRSGGSVHNSRLAPEDKTRSSSNSSLPTSVPVKVVPLSQEREVPVGQEASHSSAAKPKVYNIPVFVEGRDNKSSTNMQKPDHVTEIPVEKVCISQEKQNGPCISKSSRKPVDKKATKNSAVDLSMDQITAVLKEVDFYKEGVENFSGVQRDKQYRYLDEMLTRCMLKLDDVETHGNEEVRKARKAAIKEVEKYASMLDSKVNAQSSGDVPMAEVADTKEQAEVISVINSDKARGDSSKDSEDLEGISKENMETTEVQSCENKTDNEIELEKECENTVALGEAEMVSDGKVSAEDPLGGSMAVEIVNTNETVPGGPEIMEVESGDGKDSMKLCDGNSGVLKPCLDTKSSGTNKQQVQEIDSTAGESNVKAEN